MSLIGQRKDQNKPRKPMKRSSIRRSTPKSLHNTPLKHRTGVKTGQDKATAYESLMGSFRGLPCVVCGRMWFLKDENGKKILTSGHHLLYRSTHPEYKMTEENIIPLCGKHHVPFAHEQPNLFLEWLKEHRPEAFAWREEHKNHCGEQIGI